MRKIQQCVLAIALALSASAALAQEATPSVEVQGLKNPDMRSYRAVVAGIDAFEEHHALAPAVPELRFRLSARGGVDMPSGDALYLRIVGNGDPIPVPVAPDGTFSVPRMQSAIDDDADLVLNRRKGVLKGRPEIRTPGLPDNVRRLGDLRLECRVIVAIAKKEMGLMMNLFINTVLLTPNWCNAGIGNERIKFPFASPHALEDAEIVDGERRSPIEVSDFSYETPIADPDWSNDARIVLHYAPELSPEEKADPWLQNMFVIGTLNNKAMRIPLRRSEDGVYTTELELGKGSHFLNAGTRGLAAISLGASQADQQLAEGSAMPLTKRGKRLHLKVETAGRYVLMLDARDKETPTLRLARLP